MSLFGNLSTFDKAFMGITTVAVAGTAGIVGYKIGEHRAETKHAEVSEKVRQFTTVKSFLINSLVDNGFTSDEHIQMYLNGSVPTELDLDEKSGEAKGSRATLFRAENPGSFKGEVFPPGELSGELEKAYTRLLQCGRDRNSGDDGDLKASTLVFYMKLIRVIANAPLLNFCTERGLVFLEAIINAMYETLQYGPVAKSHVTGGRTAQAFIDAIGSMETARKIAAIETRRVSAQEYLKALRNVSLTLVKDLSDEFIKRVADCSKSKGRITVVDCSTLSRKGGWGVLHGTLLQGIIYRIFGVPIRQLSSIEATAADDTDKQLINFLALFADKGSTRLFVEDLRKNKFEGKRAVYKKHKISSGINPNITSTQFSQLINCLGQIVVAIQTFTLFIRFQTDLISFATAHGDNGIYKDGMKALLTLTQAVEPLYSKLDGISKNLCDLSKDAFREAKTIESGPGVIFRRMWYGRGDAERAMGSVSRENVIGARIATGRDLVDALRKSIEYFDEEEKAVPTSVQLNELAENLSTELDRSHDKVGVLDRALAQFEIIKGSVDEREMKQVVTPLSLSMMEEKEHINKDLLIKGDINMPGEIDEKIDGYALSKWGKCVAKEERADLRDKLLEVSKHLKEKEHKRDAPIVKVLCSALSEYIDDLEKTDKLKSFIHEWYQVFTRPVQVWKYHSFSITIGDLIKRLNVLLFLVDEIEQYRQGGTLKNLLDACERAKDYLRENGKGALLAKLEVVTAFIEGSETKEVIRLEVEVGDLRGKNTRLENENTHLEGENTRLEGENTELRGTVKRLDAGMDEMRRNMEQQSERIAEQMNTMFQEIEEMKSERRRSPVISSSSSSSSSTLLGASMSAGLGTAPGRGSSVPPPVKKPSAQSGFHNRLR